MLYSFLFVRQHRRLRRGKLSLHTSASGTHNHVTTHIIVPTLAILLFRGCLPNYTSLTASPISLSLHLSLHLYLKGICVNKDFKSLVGVRLRYSISRVILPINPSNLKQFSAFIRLLNSHNIDY